MLDRWKERLADQLVRPDEVPAPLAVIDRWGCHSLVHKAVRRGDAALAGAVGITLLGLDKVGLFKTLLTTAFEDCGIGDEATMIMCAAAADDPSWRERVGGDVRVVVSLCRLLAEAPKDRSSDNLITAARAHPGLEQYREMAGSRSVADRLRMVADAALPLSARAIAAWFGSGCDWYGVRRVGPGDLAGLLAAYGRLGVDPDLIAATRIAIRKVHEPITLMPGLLSAEARGAPSEIVTAPAPPTTMVNGIPLHAYDRFTRLGKHALAIFASKNAAMRMVLDGFVPDRRWAHVTALAAFHSEGGRLYGKRRLWRDALALEALGQEADCLPEGIAADDFTRIIETVESQLPDLDRIRKRLLSEITPPAQAHLL